MRVIIADNIKAEIKTVGMDFTSGNWFVDYKLKFPFGVEKETHHIFDRNAMNGVHGTPDQIINGLCNHLRGVLEQQKGPQ